MTYDVRNPGPGLGQVQKCGGVEPVNGFQNPPLLIHVPESPMDMGQSW